MEKWPKPFSHTKNPDGKPVEKGGVFQPFFHMAVHPRLWRGGATATISPPGGGFPAKSRAKPSPNNGGMHQNSGAFHIFHMARKTHLG